MDGHAPLRLTAGVWQATGGTTSHQTRVRLYEGYYILHVLANDTIEGLKQPESGG